MLLGVFSCVLRYCFAHSTRARVLHIHTATAVDNLTAYVARQIGSEEESYVGNILGSTTTTQGDEFSPLDGGAGAADGEERR